MKIKVKNLIEFLFGLLLHLPMVTVASDYCHGLITSEYKSDTFEGVQIKEFSAKCDLSFLRIELNDVIIRVNGLNATVNNINDLLSQIILTNDYSIDVARPSIVNHVEEGISLSEEIDSNQLSYSSLSDEITQATETQVTETQVINNLADDLSFVTFEAPLYKQVDEVGSDWLKWIKWLVFFLVLSCTLTPGLIMFASNEKNIALYLGGAAVLGAADAVRRPLKGAIESVNVAIILFFTLLLIGPLGTLYCLYRPVFAFISDADKTHCCAMTFLGGTDIAKKVISSDGHWLAEIRETQNSYLGFGDKEFSEKHTLSVMNLDTGQHVKWPQTQQKLIGVDIGAGQVERIAISDGIYIKPVNYLPGEGAWYSLEKVDDFISPVNHNSVKIPQIKYVLTSKDLIHRRVTLEEIGSGKTKEVQTNINFNADYLSYDGRVLALVEASPDSKDTDGWIKQILRLLANFVFESWRIEFWDVNNNRMIATYSGHGINKDAWGIDTQILDAIGQTKFLESSQDGRLWYMIKSDGFIHVFDLRNKLPTANNNQQQ